MRVHDQLCREVDVRQQEARCTCVQRTLHLAFDSHDVQRVEVMACSGPGVMVGAAPRVLRRSAGRLVLGEEARCPAQPLQNRLRSAGDSSWRQHRDLVTVGGQLHVDLASRRVGVRAHLVRRGDDPRGLIRVGDLRQ